MTIRHFACGLLTVLAIGSPMTLQAEPLVVVELYTSQGCSSCPPADAYLVELANNPSLMPLALHVDYWDYIGWADTFADPAFGRRQSAYAQAVGSRTVYTPQMIVGGVDRVEGNNPVAIDALILMHQKNAPLVTLDVARNGDTLAISASGAVTGPVDVAVVRYVPSELVAITRGENAGHSVAYRNIVTAWDIVGQWSGQGPLQMEATVSGAQAVVVILQKPGPADVVAAARP